MYATREMGLLVPVDRIESMRPSKVLGYSSYMRGLKKLPASRFSK